MFSLPDGDAEHPGRSANLTIWNSPGDDSLGYAIRSERMVRNVETLLGGGEVYCYHTKVNKKEPDTGGTFLPHQDWGCAKR